MRRTVTERVSCLYFLPSQSFISAPVKAYYRDRDNDDVIEARPYCTSLMSRLLCSLYAPPTGRYPVLYLKIHLQLDFWFSSFF